GWRALEIEALLITRVVNPGERDGGLADARSETARSFGRRVRRNRDRRRSSCAKIVGHGKHRGVVPGVLISMRRRRPTAVRSVAEVPGIGNDRTVRIVRPRSAESNAE